MGSSERAHRHTTEHLGLLILMAGGHDGMCRASPGLGKPEYLVWLDGQANVSPPPSGYFLFLRSGFSFGIVSICDCYSSQR